MAAVGDLTLIPGPLGVLWRPEGRWKPRLDTGELAVYARPPPSASDCGCPLPLASPGTPSSSSSLTGRRRETQAPCLAGTSIGCSKDCNTRVPKRARDSGS